MQDTKLNNHAEGKLGMQERHWLQHLFTSLNATSSRFRWVWGALVGPNQVIQHDLLD